MSSSSYGKKADLALSTWVKLSRAFNSVNVRTSAGIKSFKLTYPQFAVIEMLGHLGPLKVGDIIDKLSIKGGNMTLVLDKLEKDGLLSRSANKEDRRAIIVKLSKKGEKLFGKIFPRYAETVTELFGALTAAEQKELGNLLKKLGLKIEEKFK